MAHSCKIKILIFGKTGVGKTSLIRALAGGDVVPASAIGHSEPQTRGFCEYEDADFVYIDSEGFEPGKTLSKYKRFLKSGADAANVVVFCLDGSGARVQKFDHELLEAVSKPDRVILVVVTKKDTMRNSQKDEMKKNVRGLPVCFVSEDDRGSIKHLKTRIRKELVAVLKNVRAEIRCWKEMSLADIAVLCKPKFCPKSGYRVVVEAGGINEKDYVVFCNRSGKTWLRMCYDFYEGRVRHKGCRDRLSVLSGGAYRVKCSKKTIFLTPEIESLRLWLVMESDAEACREEKIAELKNFQNAVKRFAVKKKS